MIREALLTDLPKIAELLLEAAPEVEPFGSTCSQTDLEALFYNNDYLKLISRGTLILVDDAVTGVLIAYDMGNWGYIDILYVAKAHRQSGVGRDLIQYLFTHLPLRWTTLEFCFAANDQVREQWAKREGFAVKSPVRWAIKQLDPKP